MSIYLFMARLFDRLTIRANGSNLSPKQYILLFADMIRVITSILALSLLIATANSEETLGHKYEAPPMTPLAHDGIHDPTNDAIISLQDPKESMINFPKDRRGEVDWVKALEEGVINPRKTRTGKEGDGPPMVELDLDIIMKNTEEMPHVRFPHLPHTKWLACSNCHPDIFIQQEGANEISMLKILRGEFCGRCHDKVSFSLYVCERCHSIPHEKSGPAWW